VIGRLRRPVLVLSSAVGAGGRQARRGRASGTRLRLITSPAAPS